MPQYTAPTTTSSGSRSEQLSADLIEAGKQRLAAGDISGGKRLFLRAELLCPESSGAQEGLARVERRLGNLRTALAYAEAALHSDPECTEAQLVAIWALKGLGDADAARRHLQDLLSRQPELPRALYLLAHDGGDLDESLLAEKLKDADLPAADKRMLTLALANVIEHSDNPARSVEVAHAAHAEEVFNYHPEFEQELLQRIREQIEPGSLGGGGGDAKARPIFIVGSPHAGSSLVERALTPDQSVYRTGPTRALEQLCGNLPRCVGAPYPRSVVSLDAHTASVLAGRYRNCAGLPKDTQAWTDRCPESVLYLPLALRLFPGAKIVHVTREPVTAAHDCELTCFDGIEAPYARHADDYLTHQAFEVELMELYKDVLPTPIVHVRYEDLVDSSLNAAADLRQTLGLDVEQGPEAA
ncbi:MAG: tetratricopeptide (TPR) repeat protein [Planctomycetota bacterium]|jgi:tetratricopeptide (TPR) repeat protein